ncbi:MAG: IS200/IS605 family transposase [Saprospiraceae bacterium]
MANTFSQMYAHLIFSPKGRQNLILPSFEESLFKYLTGIVQNKGQKMIAINGMPDHLHIFIGFKPSLAISDLVRDVKASSTNFINESRFLPGKFFWQEGFGCFTHSHSQVDTVAKYVLHQKEQHKKQSFREEYLALLKKLDIPFEERYLFEFYH